MSKLITDLIADPEKYMKEKAETNPVLRMKLARQKEEEEKLEAAEQHAKAFAECVEFKAENERWNTEKQNLQSMGINMPYINQKHKEHLNAVEDIKKAFDTKALPSQKVETPKTGLETAKDELDLAIAKIDHVIVEGKKLLEDM